MKKSFYVYLLITIRKKRYITYVGYTNNLSRRLKQHNLNKGAKFTKGNFWKVIYKKKYNTKRLAMKNEYLLKKNYNLRNKIKYKFITNG